MLETEAILRLLQINRSRPLITHVLMEYGEALPVKRALSHRLEQLAAAIANRRLDYNGRIHPVSLGLLTAEPPGARRAQTRGLPHNYVDLPLAGLPRAALPLPLPAAGPEQKAALAALPFTVFDQARRLGGGAIA